MPLPQQNAATDVWSGTASPKQEEVALTVDAVTVTVKVAGRPPNLLQVTVAVVPVVAARSDSRNARRQVRQGR